MPDMDAARAIVDIKKEVSLPIIADIHFDYRLALAALDSGVDGFRLNPGNIGDRAQIRQVVLAAKKRAVPIRIGLNAGSLPKQSGADKPVAQRMVDAALEQVRLLESLDFDLIKVSLKAFDVPTTIAAYRSIAEKIPYPLHIGITEAGTPRTGIIRSSVGIGSIGELARCERDWLVQQFGRSNGSWMYEAAWGWDDRPVVTESEPKVRP